MKIIRISKVGLSKLFPSTGFTLIEILVVFSLVSILSGVGLTSFVKYSRSQQVAQSANDIKLLVSQARSSALSTVKANTDINGDRVDCYNVEIVDEDKYEKLVGYAIVKVGADQLQLQQICDNLDPMIIKSITLPTNVVFAGTSTCSRILFDSLTSQVSEACTLVVTGYNLFKTISIDAIGNVTIN